MAAFALFPQLAPELQAEVAAHVGRSDLVRLNRASRSLHALTRHVLYRAVDLDLVVFEARSQASPYQLDNAIDLRGAQRMLIATLAAHPHYALFVRDVAWHVFLDDPAPPPVPISPVMMLPDFLLPPGLEMALALAPSSSSFGPRLHHAPAQHGADDATLSPFDLFPMLANAERVRLNFSHGILPDTLPERLFPRARALNLAGLATERLYGSLLHSVGRLRELVLDHIHSPEPGFLVRLLGHLAGRCESLERLELHKAGNARSDDVWYNVVEEEQTLGAFADLANACRPTLRRLALGLSHHHNIVLFGADNRPAHVRSWMLPRVFAPELGPWPRLASFVLEGVALDLPDLEFVRTVSPHVCIFLRAADAPREHAVPLLAETPPKVLR